jgi:hypothetical protein
MVEDVMFVSIAEQNETTYRGMEGGVIEPDMLPEDPMIGLMVSDRMPEGYYAEPAKVDTPSQDGTDEPVEGEF